MPQGEATAVATIERRQPASRIAHETAAVTAPTTSPASSLPAKTAAAESHVRQSHAETAQSQAVSPATARAQVRALLLSDLQRYFEYPHLARLRGWQGMVWLSVTVRPDGILDAIHVAKSSGYALLDRSAMDAMQRVGQLTEARRWLRDEPVELPLPILYQLTD
jgi:protein TonB